jgi:hypothetical protein
MSYHEEFEELLRQSCVGGVAGVELADAAARLADVHGDRRLGYRARRALISYGIFSGMPERSLVAFSWCVALSDAEPEEFPDRDLLWPYKWVAENLPPFAQFSRAQIMQTLDDMEARFRKRGVSLRPVYLQRARTAMVLGAPHEEISARLAEFRGARRDNYSDCAACEQNFEVEVLLHVKQFAQAQLLAAPLLSGQMSCAEIPHITNAILILPAWQAGERDAAGRYARRARELCGGNRDFLRELAAVLDHAVLTQDWEQATELLERHLGWAVEVLDTSRRMRYFMAAEAALRALVAARGAVLPLRLPSTVPVVAQERGVDGMELARWLGERVDEMAAQYAARDGHDGVIGQVAEHRAMYAAS